MFSCLFRSTLPVLLLLSPALASDQSNPILSRQLRKVEAVHVELSFSFKEGANHCRPEPVSLRTEAELVLRSAGIRVTKKRNEDNDVWDALLLSNRTQANSKISEALRRLPHLLEVNATGVYVKSIDLCVASISFALFRPELLHDNDVYKSAGIVMAFGKTEILTAHKSQIQPMLHHKIQDVVKDMALKILKARLRESQPEAER